MVICDFLFAKEKRKKQMTLKEPLKQFCAVSYDNQIYHFIIKEDNKIYCCEFLLETGADVLEIKPNFVLRNGHYQTMYSLKDFLKQHPKKEKKIDYTKCLLGNISEGDLEKQQKNLISCYIIEPKVLEYMIENKMIMYSCDMAMLYRLDPTYAYDRCFQTRSFKKKRTQKAKILAKQKKGIFS